MKIWLGGITNSKDILELIDSSLPYFDGMVFTLDDKTEQSVINSFDEYSKNNNFHYVKRTFNQAHDWRANDWLYSGYIKSNDYVFIMDSTDRFNLEFLKNIKQYVNYFLNNQINTVYIDRPLAFRFTGHQYFQSSPHWGLSGTLDKHVSLIQKDFKKENFVINTRDVLRYGIVHPIKYFCEYKRSNATQLLYQQFGDDIWHKHEIQRISFQIYVEKELGFECNVKNLIDYISNGISNKTLPSYIINYIELEVNMKDLVRFYILKQNFLEEIAKNRFNWSFIKFYEQGISNQNINDGYIGDFNRYRMNQGKLME